MNKTVKYAIGAGALFLAGAASCYLFTGDVKALWNKTKYVAYQTQKAMLECDDKINETIVPEPVQTVNEGIVRTFHGMTKE